MEYRVLGPLEVFRDGHPVAIGRYKLRALLALLLINADEVVSTDRIIDEIWGDDAGSDRQNSLWVAISGLRSALDPERQKRTDGSIVLTRSPGYLINTEVAAIDARRFEQLATEGRALLDADPPAASLVLQDALALWRGHALEEFTYESFAQPEIARLEEMRLSSVEDRILADLRSGRDRELIGELESLVRQHPLRERLTGHLMVALHRTGRQADALRVFGALRTRLGEELGIEPGAEVARLEERIVLDDPELAGPAGATSPPGLSVRGYELRDRIAESAVGYVYRAYQPSVGREVAVKVVRPELANDPDFIRRFEANAQLVSRLEHPGIVPLFDYWREPDAAYLVTPRFEAGSLTDALAEGPLETTTALRVIEQVGGALAAAHRQGITHGDLKPGNVLLDSEGNAYVSGFGTALPGNDGEFAAPEGGISIEADVYSLGALTAAALRGATGERDSPLVGPTATVVAKASATDPAERYADVETYLAELAHSVGAAALDAAADVENPYKGLRAFEEGDAGRFFGRERLIERLVARLGHAGSQGKLVTLVGPSGAGKSSVVRAGLIPALRAGALPRSDRWFIVTMTPGRHPFESLEEALRKVAVDPPASILEQLTERGIAATVEAVLPEEGTQLLLVVDQLEELFTHTSETPASQFLDAVADAAADKHGPVKFVATLRADFYDHPLRHTNFGELLRLGTEVITPMTAQDLERAISGPAEGIGVAFEQGLVAQIVSDMAGQGAALPLLQYALTELFDDRTGRTISTEAYENLGGASAALVRRADSLYGGLEPPARRATRDILLRLVTLGEGGEDTRRRALQTELLDAGGPASRDVLDTFGRHRLLSFDRDPATRGPTVEIAHEAMLTEWRRLRDWIDAARHDVRNQRRIAQAMEEWKVAGGADEYLLGGGRLQQLEAWAATSEFRLAKSEQAFLDASSAARQAAEAQERRKEERAAAAEQRERQRSRQLAGAGIVSLVVAILAAFGIWQWRSATAANAEVEALLTVADLVTASEESLATDPGLALLLGVQALRQSSELGFATEEAVDAVHWALQEIGVQYEVGPDTPVAVRSGPGGLAGVYALSPAELVQFAEKALERRLSPAECEPFYSGPCPNGDQIPDDLPLQFGMEAYGAAPPGGQALSGTSITFAASSLRGDNGFTLQLEAFTEATGIEIDHVASENQDILNVAIGDLELPDINVAQGGIPSWSQPRALDLTKFLDAEQLRSDFGDYLMGFGSIYPKGERPPADGTPHAIPIDVDLKGLVYYPKAAFDAAGYQVPAALDELMALSSQIVADGGTPWCFGFDSGFASGWPGSDFIESLVLRVGGAEVYDAWTYGEVGFAGPPVMEAGRIANDFVFSPGFVRGGPDAISNEGFDGQLFNVLERNSVTGEPEPDCWLHHQSDFVLGNVPATTVIGEDLSFFVLPPLQPGEPTTITGGASFAAALVDRPEVRVFMEFLASPEWGQVWASVPGSSDGGLGAGFFPGNRRFDLTTYGTGVDEQAGSVLQTMANEVRSALAADTWRYDASDQMPVRIGGWNEDFTPGPFWQGMIDWVDGVRTIDQVFADVDEAWAQLAADGG